MKILIRCLLFMLVVLCSCNTGNKDVVVNDDNSNYFDFERVEDLVVFFDSIESRHGIATWTLDSIEYQKRVRKCVADLDSYRKQIGCTYPAKEVINVLFEMAWNIDCGQDHMGLPMSMEYFEWLLRLAAFYCPDVNLLSQVPSENGESGYIDFCNAYDNMNPFVAYKLQKRKKGFEIIGVR